MIKQQNRASFLSNWAQQGGLNSGIVRQLTSGRQGERTILALDPIFDPKKQQEIYNFRRDTKAPLVNVYGSEILKQQKPNKLRKQTKDPYKHILVITQRIPHRLANAPQLTYPESLYVLDRCLQGYEIAYQKCGPIKVNERMIGFNNQGECKVWVNQDFSNNHPQYPRSKLVGTSVNTNQYIDGKILDVTIDQCDMVQEITDLVQNYSEQGRFPEPFVSQIRSSYISFADARRLLNKTITQSQFLVPDRIDLFTNKVRRFRKGTITHQQYGYKEYTQNYAPIEKQQIKITNQYINQLPPDTRPVSNTQYTQNLYVPSSFSGQYNMSTQQFRMPPQYSTNVTKTQIKAPNNFSTVQPITGYRFNYLPVSQFYKPSIFASRLNQYGMHQSYY